MDLYCLRVKSESAGRSFPFDRVYLARNGEHTVFKKLFRYALILPVEPGLKENLIQNVEIEKGETHSFDRDDEAAAPTPSEWQEALEEGEWVMAVPILSKYVAGNMPRYITAAGKYRNPSASNAPTGRGRRGRVRLTVEEPFPTLTYLQTPEQNIRPVCVACPRFILHQNGHCRLGEQICYESLALGMQNHFKDALDTAPLVENEMLAAEDD